MKKPSKKSMCLKCEWYSETVQGICPAFPYGIPDKYLNTDAVHDKVDEGQETSTTFMMKDEFLYPEL